MRKSFQRGMEAGAKPFEEKFRMQIQAIDKLGNRLEKKLDDYSDILDVMIDDLSARDKKELFDLNSIYDISNMDDTEKEVLVSLLYTLAREEQKINELQQQYVRTIQRYLDVKQGQVLTSFEYIENVESSSDQQAILQCVMEFLFLGYGNFEFIDIYQDVFEYFSVNRRGFERIKESVQSIVSATGNQGLVEKFGFEIQEEKEIHQEKIMSRTLNRSVNKSVFCDEYIKKVAFVASSIEIDRYFAFIEDLVGPICVVSKEDGSVTTIELGYDFGLYNDLLGYGDYIVCFMDESVVIIEASTKKQRVVERYLHNAQFVGDYIYYKNDKNDLLYKINIHTLESKLVALDGNGMAVDKYWAREEGIYFVPNDFSNQGMKLDSKYLYYYNIVRNEIEAVAEVPTSEYGRMWVGNEYFGDTELVSNGTKIYLVNKMFSGGELIVVSYDVNSLEEGACVEKVTGLSGDSGTVLIHGTNLYIIVANEDFPIYKYDLLSKEKICVIPVSHCGEVSVSKKLFSGTSISYHIFNKPQILAEHLRYKANGQIQLLALNK